MGGKVAIGLIEKDGALKTITGWTNPIPKAVKNEAFSAGDVSSLREYLEFYGNDRGGQGYGPTGNVPSEYGYVLFDLRESAIVSAQSYTSFGECLGIQIHGALSGTGDGTPRGDDGLARMITHRMDWDEDRQEMRATPVGPFADAAEMAGTPDAIFLPGRGRTSRHYAIRYQKWSLIDGDGSGESLALVRDYLSSRNLLSPAEREAWAAAIEGNARERESTINEGGPAASAPGMR